MDILGKNAIVKYEKTKRIVPNNNKLKLFNGKASVNMYWLTIVDIDNNVKVIFIESEAPSVYAETIVAETGIKAVEGLWVETLKEGQSYPDFLISAVELIVENLSNTD